MIGSTGVNVESSLVLSYAMIVPSACETRKSVADVGIQRTAVQGELLIHP